MKRKLWNWVLLGGTSALAMMTAAQADAATTTLTFTGSEVTWTAPTTGVYDILAYGAQGGNHTFAAFVPGGLGAEAGGDVTLTAGTRLTVLVGGKGGSYAGGGGSFVLVGGSTLVAAGGGGGAGTAGFGNGGGGLASSSGGAGTNGGAGGKNGGGGGYGSGLFLPGGGGAGVNGPGGGYYGARSITSVAHSSLGSGGFGGGGGANLNGGGGGGGFSGGGGGYYGGGGGGGGSFVASSFTNQVLSGSVNAGNGVVTISGVASGVPEPSTWALTLTGFAGLGVLGLRRGRKLEPSKA
jgi:hypothetical protein